MQQLSAAEDGMILILPARSIAVISSLAETVFEESPAEVPAARPLAEVSPQGPDIADLGNRDLAGCLGKKGISTGNQRRGCDVAQGRGGTDL